MASVLEKADAIFGRWALGPCRSAAGMRSSKFEQRVVDTLKVLGVDTDRIVREVVVPVAVSDRMRRILDRRPKLVPPEEEVAEFQKHDHIDLRFDLAWIDEENGGHRLMIVEVDGSQHAKTHSWFNGTKAMAADDDSAPPRPQCRDMIKDELVSQALVGFADALCFFRVSPRFERDTHPNRQAMLRNILTWIIDPKTDPTHLNPGLFAGMLSPSTTAAAAAAGTSPQPSRFRKSKSEPRQPKPDTFGIAVDPEEQRKNRTMYNRWCKGQSGSSSSSREHHLTLLFSRRQRASDSRKRPRDDQGNVYDPRWFKSASLWAAEQEAAVAAAVGLPHPRLQLLPTHRPVPPGAKSWA